jgi:chromosomal replication initiation ATPase DnaA
MTSEPEQLAFDLPLRSALGAEDFLVSASNEAAVAVIDRWPDWPHAAIFVAGPAGSGKSHLVNVWRTKAGGEIVAAADIDEGAVTLLEQSGALAIEDVDRGIGDERVLFHILNTAVERKLSLLLTGRGALGEMKIGLPDLRSRLRALPCVQIAMPDELLLRALLVKLFADRQLSVEPHVVSFLALRIERSMEAAAAIVAEVDRVALASHRKVTRALAAEAFARYETVRHSPHAGPAPHDST